MEKENTKWNVVIKYADDLLTDERTTLGDVNRSSLTFRIEDAEASSTMNPLSTSGAGMQGEQYVKWNRKTATKLPLKNVDFSFGMYKLSVVAVMVLLPLIAYHIYEYIANFQDANKLVNMVDLYGLTADMRNVHNIMRQALISTILWNNTMPMLGKPSATTYQEFSKTMRDSIVFSLNSKKRLNYGSSFSAFFNNVTSENKVCNLITKYGTGYAKCGKTSLTSMDINIVMFIRSLASLTDDIFSSWQTQNYEPNIVSELFRVPKFTNYLGITYNHSVVDDLYYIVMRPLAGAISSQLESEVSDKSGASTVR